MVLAAMQVTATLTVASFTAPKKASQCTAMMAPVSRWWCQSCRLGRRGTFHSGATATRPSMPTTVRM